jgi:hypothetical protein
LIAEMSAAPVCMALIEVKSPAVSPDKKRAAVTRVAARGRESPSDGEVAVREAAIPRTRPQSNGSRCGTLIRIKAASGEAAHGLVNNPVD